MQNSSNSHRSGERAPADCYTVAEAASVLGYSESWIRQLCRARRIGHLKRNIREGVRWRRQLWIPRRELQTYITAYRRFEYIPADPAALAHALLPSVNRARSGKKVISASSDGQATTAIQPEESPCSLHNSEED